MEHLVCSEEAQDASSKRNLQALAKHSRFADSMAESHFFYSETVRFMP